jgi:hypothetical protein
LDLFRIHIAFKADLQALIAELMYGEPLRIPGELLIRITNPVEPAHLIAQHRQQRALTRPVPAALHASADTFFHKDLTTARTPFSTMMQHAWLWSPLTAAPTRFSRGERKRYNFLCAVSISPCRSTVSSQLHIQRGRLGNTTFNPSAIASPATS